ncbi:MAG: phosphoglycerate dehydrogenase [Christensenellales bacterium]
MGKILVTVTKFDERCPEARQLLEENGHEIIMFEGKPRDIPKDKLELLIKDIVACIIGWDPWDAEMLQMAKNLKTIGRFGVGCDNIDLAAAKDLGIKVVNAVGANAEAVAEITICLIIGVLRNVTGLYNDLLNGTWRRAIGFEVKGKTIGLIGFGNIARRVAKILKAFDANIIVYKRHRDDELAKEYGVTMAGLEEVIANCDILSLHIPAAPDNFHMMNDKTFSMMKKGSYFINMGRGSLVDEAALIRAIENGQLIGAGLDVFENEPITKDNPLLKHERIIGLPHTAGETYEAWREIALTVSRGILQDFAGKVPVNWVNP